VYVGSTTQPLETRMRRHITDAFKKIHTNKELAKIIRDSHNMVVADVLVICNQKQRPLFEYEKIMELWRRGNRLTNKMNPLHPRQKLSFAKKKKKGR
jgi:hypothetical protein